MRPTPGSEPTGRTDVRDLFLGTRSCAASSALVGGCIVASTTGSMIWDCSIRARSVIKSTAYELVKRGQRTSLTLAIAVTAAISCLNPADAAGDADKGGTVFIRQCALCHTIAKGEPNRFGPNLFGIVDRKAGIAPGYNYSSAFLAMANWTWSPDGIASFVAAPEKTIPGNRMGVFQGIAERDEQDLLAYLATQK